MSDAFQPGATNKLRTKPIDDPWHGDHVWQQIMLQVDDEEHDHRAGERSLTARSGVHP
jgi:hypothetical protein